MLKLHAEFTDHIHDTVLHKYTKRHAAIYHAEVFFYAPWGYLIIHKAEVNNRITESCRF